MGLIYVLLLLAVPMTLLGSLWLVDWLLTRLEDRMADEWLRSRE